MQFVVYTWPFLEDFPHFSRRSSWQRAWRLFDGTSLDLVARSIAASGAAWRSALALLGDTAPLGLRRDTVLLNGALGSCAAATRREVKSGVDQPENWGNGDLMEFWGFHHG